MEANIIKSNRGILSRFPFSLNRKRIKGSGKQLMTFFVVLFLFLSYCGMASSLPGNRDTVLNISFGTKNKIVYHFATGKYDALFSGGIQMMQAGAIVGRIDTTGKVNPLFESTNTTYRNFTKSRTKTAYGPATVYCIYRKDKTGVILEQAFTTFKDKNYFLARTKVYQCGRSINYCSPLVNAKVSLNWGGDNYGLHSPFDNDMWATYESERLDSLKFTSSEISVIFNENRKGLVVGSLEHKVWKSGIYLQGNSARSFQLTAFGGYTDQKLTHDLRSHGTVQSEQGIISSPLIMVGYFDDWRSGMEIYGSNNKLTEPPVIAPWKGATPVGWNSWGVLQDKIDLPSAKGVIDFFADSCKLYRTKDHKLFIDLDSFWDRMIEGGLDGNSDKLKAFVSYCNAKGFEPGIYWAPFTDWGKQGDRKVEGSDYSYKDVWTYINGKPLDVDGGRAMDPTHPGTRARIVKYIEFFKSLGFKMIKIDFLGHATLEADHYYDSRVTTGMEAFCNGMTFLDSMLSNKMLTYAAISPNLATARYVHMRRIACDAFKSIAETAYTLNSVTYGWWQGHMYDFMDADHVVFKDASIGENRARLASAVVTGSLITGDDYSKRGPWRTTAMKLLQNKDLLAIVGKDGKPFRPVVLEKGKAPSNVFEKRMGNKLYLGVFNYGENKTTMKLSLLRLGIKSPKSSKMIMGPSTAKADFSDGQVSIQLPGKDAAIFCLDL